jgi:uncharacterized peroxidase-related enzyme
MPLVDPLSADHDSDVARLAEFFNETLGFCPNSVLTMQRRPRIAKAFIELNMAVMENLGSITAEQKRLIAYVSSAATGCRYCEAHTALAANRYGGRPERVEAVWDFENSDLFTQAERAAFRYALAASSVPNSVDEKIAADLKTFWTDDEIVEIAGVVALFGFLNRWNDSMGTTMEDGAVETGENHLAHTGWSRGKHV